MLWEEGSHARKHHSSARGATTSTRVVCSALSPAPGHRSVSSSALCSKLPKNSVKVSAAAAAAAVAVAPLARSPSAASVSAIGLYVGFTRPPPRSVLKQLVG